MGSLTFQAHPVPLEIDGIHALHEDLLTLLADIGSSAERAEEFGDYILEAAVPHPKIFFYNQLLPGTLKGEDELVVIEGLYEVSISTL